MKKLILGGILGLASLMNIHAAEEDIINAYIYGFPLVLMDVTKDVLTDSATVTDTKVPINQFLSKKTFPDPSFTEVVSPNADTLYTQAWLDLSKEPMILSVPEMGDRYYLFPMLDEWTNVFFSPGTRTTGGGKGNFAITGPNWQGTLPDGMKGIKSSTDIVWILGRIQTNGPSDFAAVNKLQEQFKLTPLSSWGTAYTPPANLPVKPGVDGKTAPIAQVLRMSGAEFFKRLSTLLKTTPIPAGDLNYVKNLNFTPQDDQALNAAVKKAQTLIQQDWDQHTFAKTVNNWGIMEKGIGSYGTDYKLRAAVAFGGLGANLPEDAIYPVTNVDSTGQQLTGKYNYVVHFEKNQIPPVNAFWSLTMYNDKHFFVENPINRYAIGDRDALQFNADGTLDLYLQNKAPGNGKDANWLPAPEGDFNLLLRLYDPKPEVFNGTWTPPLIKRVN